MAGKQSEQISAYVDGELGTDEQQFLWRRFSADPEARQALIRLYEMQAVVHRERVAGANQIADQVRVALAQEPAHAAVDKPGRRFHLSPIFQPVAGLAIAASVALGLVAIWPVSGIGPTSPDVPNVASAPPPMFSATLPISPVSAPVASQSPQQLSPYFINHSEYSGLGQFGGTLQYARIVGYDDEP